ncbi:uncharacterized protein F5Z01DRAFT_220457 [Emericellopsis atlantica]|uniref:Uncharacterized protein n=1 Tax=Emericellopsis atlantica TaxID=2614577 RepID=A0A9P7ZJ14_9HYPO|nr:uncharacterized protein F5Z01DRAFT_220457 [Emericellopsis atlantica]KAG9252621.1 hypothetical protein F5Z01DRAFT_220457 [Emericellopsis atlantica]
MESLRGSHLGDPIVIDDEERSPDQLRTNPSINGVGPLPPFLVRRRDLNLHLERFVPLFRIPQWRDTGPDGSPAGLGVPTGTINLASRGPNYAAEHHERQCTKSASDLFSLRQSGHYSRNAHIPDQASTHGSNSNTGPGGFPNGVPAENDRHRGDIERHPHRVAPPMPQDMSKGPRISPDVPASATNDQVEKEEDNCEECADTSQLPPRAKGRESTLSIDTIDLGLFDEAQAAPTDRDSTKAPEPGQGEWVQKYEVDMDALKAHDKAIAMNPRNKCICSKCVPEGTCFRVILRHQRVCRPCLFACYGGDMSINTEKGLKQEQ